MLNDKETSNSEKALLTDYAHLFKNNGRLIHNYTVTLNFDSSAISKCYQSRRIPFHLREQVEKSVKDQVDSGFLEPVIPSKEDVKWSTPILTVRKANGLIRICGDFRITVNRHLNVDSYILLTWEDVTCSERRHTIFND
ncbi:hypothetical protein GJ496_002227 [Pomphorhynchus laevis]|nr:hypothetical protein GJ496_002227 [Pomphorhynchus laevis]